MVNNMTFERQATDGKFVAFGKKKAKPNSYLVEEKEYLECVVQNVKPSTKFGLILEVKTKDVPDTLLVVGNTILRRELGYEWNDFEKEKGDFDKLKPIEECQVNYRVQSSDKIRIHFEGMVKGKKGNDAYGIFVEVDK